MYWAFLAPEKRCSFSNGSYRAWWCRNSMKFPRLRLSESSLCPRNEIFCLANSSTSSMTRDRIALFLRIFSWLFCVANALCLSITSSIGTPHWRFSNFSEQIWCDSLFSCSHNFSNPFFQYLIPSSDHSFE